MKEQIRFLIRGIVAAMIASAAFMTTATAQLPWNPPCANATVINLTGCPANLAVISNPPGAFGAVAVPGCGSVLIPALPFPTSVSGVVTQTGTFVPIVTPGFLFAPFPTICPGVAPPFVAPSNGVVTGVVLGPNGCCFDVHFYTVNDPGHPCTIVLTPGTTPCIP